MRVILYTGKGGVGKTSVAAATAVLCAGRGQRTMLISTDPAHSVADAFDIEGSQGAHQLSDNLWIHEIDALHELEENWVRVHKYATAVLASQGIDEIVADELATPPGISEVASLMWIRRYFVQKEFDVLVVDCAPTGETLQLLSFPEVARWWLKKVFPIERQIMKVARPLVQPLTDLPLPKDEVFVSIKDFLLDLGGTRDVLSDPTTTSVRLVINLEKMVIKEAQRAYTYLNLYDYQTDAIVVNRILPPAIGEQSRFLEGWRKAQSGYEGQVSVAFGDVPIFHAPLFEREVVGESMLERLGQAVFGKHDPATLFHQGHSQRVERQGSDYVLAIDLPFASKENIELTQKDAELFVRVGPHRRDISLPRVLARRRSRGARFEGNTLRIFFASEAGAASKGGS